jgi:hypothetical protein
LHLRDDINIVAFLAFSAGSAISPASRALLAMRQAFTPFGPKSNAIAVQSNSSALIWPLSRRASCDLRADRAESRRSAAPGTEASPHRPIAN